MKRLRAVSLVLVAILDIGVVFGVEPRGIAELLKALDGDGTQFDAIRELEDLGLDAAPAVPRLIQLLDSPDKDTRAATAGALGAIGKDAMAAIPKLITWLDRGELPRVSTELPIDDEGVLAAFAIGKMGKDAVPFLLPCLVDKRSAVRSNAACALWEIGPDAKCAVTPLVARLKDSDWLVRQCAAEALSSIRIGEHQVVSALVVSLKDENFNVRRSAASALGEVRPATPPAIDGLILALRDDNGNVQNAAAEALGKLGGDAVPAIPALVRTLKSRKSYVYGHPGIHLPVATTAAWALGELGPRAKKAMPALLQAIQDKNATFEQYGPDDRVKIGGTLGAVAAAKIDPQSDDLLRVLKYSLQDDDIRVNAAAALGIIGPKAKGTVNLLVRFAEMDVESPDALVYACAAVAIEPDNAVAVKTMLDLLHPKQRHLDVVYWDLLRTALERVGARSRPAIPTLIRMVSDRSEDQEQVARTLAVFGPEAESAIPALLELLPDGSEELRNEAIAALQKIASEKSAPLLAALKSDSVPIRSGAVEVLGHFPGALPRLAHALDDPSARVRLAALRSLATLGVHSKPASPQIRELLRADSRTIREAAALALQETEER